MAVVYKAGGVASNVRTGLITAQAALVAAATYVIFREIPSGAQLQVTAGTTYVIGTIVAGANSGTIDITYDDNGAGLNEVVLVTIASAVLIPPLGPRDELLLSVPAGKFLKARGSNATVSPSTIYIAGWEV